MCHPVYGISSIDCPERNAEKGEDCVVSLENTLVASHAMLHNIS